MGDSKILSSFFPEDIINYIDDFTLDLDYNKLDEYIMTFSNRQLWSLKEELMDYKNDPYMDFYIDIINHVLAEDWNGGMIAAAKSDHLALVEFFVSRGANAWNSGMYFAIKNGNVDLVDFFKRFRRR